MDFRTFRKVAKIILDTKKPVMMRGRHGIGKSEVVYQIAADRKMRVVERRASQMQEGDLLGLPSIKDKAKHQTTTWNPPEWFIDACSEPVVLFFDELDRGPQEVRQGLFELTDSRKMAGFTLHPDTLIIAAINGGESGSQYQVFDLDPAEIDRWTVFDLSPTAKDWLDYSKDKVSDVTWNFINSNKEWLEHKGEFEPNKKYPSRRSWFRADEALTKAGLLTEVKDNATMIRHIVAGFCGLEASVAYNDFCSKFERQVTVEDVIDNGQISKTKDFQLGEHAAFVNKVFASGKINKGMGDAQLKNSVAYFVSLPAEAACKFFEDFSKEMLNAEKGQAPEMIKKFHGATANGVKVSERLKEIYSGVKQS